MENANEKNIIIESNRINIHPGEELVGALLRLVGISKKWRPFVYAKKEVFLEEYRPASNRMVDFPRETIDLTGIKVEGALSPSTGGLGKVEVAKAFKLTARNGKVLYLRASTVEEKNAWVKVLSEDQVEENQVKAGQIKTSSIAPLRRRQISIQDLNRRAQNKAARIETDPKGILLRYNDTAEVIFGWSATEMIGQNVSKLIPERMAAKHNDTLTNSSRRVRVGAVMNKYRTVQAVRKDGEEFEIQIHLEMTSEGNYLANIVETHKDEEEYEEEDPDEYKIIQNLRVRLVEAKDLGGVKPSKKAEKQFDPYCIILIDNEKKATTTTKLATYNPFWGEDYFFDDIGNSCKVLKVVINNQNKVSHRDPRHGQIVVDLKTHLHGRPVEKWYSIMPVRSDEGGADNPIGSMRIKATLISEKILPFKEYSELLELVLDDELTIFNALASVAGSQLEEIAGTLVNIFSMENRVVGFIKNLTHQEVQMTDDVNIIFRGNSLTTKVIDLYMKVVAMNHLHSVVTDLVEEVYKDKESCEIDPSRLEKSEDIEENTKRLISYCTRFFEAIASSIGKLPPELACVFENIRLEVVEKYPKASIEKYTCVSGFIFLRFFCPAILDPNLFGMMDEHPTGGTARTLTLIAKTLQNLANLVEAGVDKEPYMEKVNPFIKKNMQKMMEVIDGFSIPSIRDSNAFERSDQRNLRRELSALDRYFSDKLEILKGNASKTQPDPKVGHLFSVIEKLGERHQVYDVRMSDSVRRPTLHISAIKRNEVLYENNNPHTPI